MSLWVAACGGETQGTAVSGGSFATGGNNSSDPSATASGGSSATGGNNSSDPSATASGGSPATGGNSSTGPSATSPRLFLRAVAAGNGTYVATGVIDSDAGTDSVILASEDGMHWATRYRGGDEELASVAYGNGHWVAVGWGYQEIGSEYVPSRAVLVSDDAVNWRNVSSPESDGFHAIIWTGSEFLMHGQRTTDWAMWASPTGVEWTERSSGSDVPSALAVGVPGLVGSFGAQVALSVDAGASWQRFQLTDGREAVGFWPVGNGFDGTATYSCCFHEIPGSDTYYTMHSDDGLEWHLQQTTDPIPRSAVHLAETWVGISAKNSLLLHRNASTPVWTETSQQATAVTVGDRFVAVQHTVGILNSQDGTTCRATASSFAFHWVENVFHAERWKRRQFGAILRLCKIRESSVRAATG